MPEGCMEVGMWHIVLVLCYGVTRDFLVNKFHAKCYLLPLVKQGTKAFQVAVQQAPSQSCKAGIGPSDRVDGSARWIYR